MTHINKRLYKEIRHLITQQNGKELLENDYLVIPNESDVNLVHAIIKPPHDSVYRHKFVRLDIRIPDNYPHSPPEVIFVNHDGVRIHPNMYENGKCCATILNTWGDNQDEKWTSSMGIETVLLTFHSFLDNNPYTYEPGGGDDPAYTVYVLYQSWLTCLIRYIQHETIPEFIQFIHNYLLTNIEEVFSDLYQASTTYPYGNYNCNCFEIDYYIINYERILNTLQTMFCYIEYKERNFEELDYTEFASRDYSCSICFDTLEESNKQLIRFHPLVRLSCNHQFHKDCIVTHANTNHPLCPMCRTKLNPTDISKFKLSIGRPGWIINPQTKRYVKIGSRTYNYLIEQGIIKTDE